MSRVRSGMEILVGEDLMVREDRTWKECATEFQGMKEDALQ